jgi:transposase-like protein
MARRLDKEKVLKMRIEQEMSYSEIKAITGICKSTLSDWLRDYPLNKERIRELNADSEKRIERFRNTMRQKVELRLASTYDRAKKDIGFLNKRERFIAGLFLYWGEGDKTKGPGISNTDAGIIKFYILWLKDMGFKEDQLICRLDLYKDMNIVKEISYWNGITGIGVDKISTCIKPSALTGLTYKNGFGHGTCRIILSKKHLFEYILMCLKYFREIF